MTSRHGVTPEEANGALADPDTVTLTPDPASISGRADSSGRIRTVIILDHDGTRYGVNGWPANPTDQRRYITGGDAS